MTTRIKLRRDSAANWSGINPVLALGEPGYDTTNNKLKIGDGETAWDDLAYLTDVAGSNSLVNGEHEFLLDASGNLFLDGEPFTGGGANTGDIAFNQGIIYNDNNNGTIYIDPSNDSGNTGYITVPGPADADNTTLSIGNQMNGGVQIQSGVKTWMFDSDGILTLPSNNYLETTNINLAVGSQGDVIIRSNAADNINDKTWTFNSTGTLVLPEGGDIVDSNGDSVLGAANLGRLKIQGDILGTVDNPNTGGWGGWNLNLDPGGESSAGIVIPSVANQQGGGQLQIFNTDTSGGKIMVNTYGGLTVSSARGVLGLGLDLEIPGAPSHFHVAFETSNQYIPTADLFFGDDYNYVQLVNNAQGVFVGTNDRSGGSQYQWRFKTNGDLQLPEGGDIVDHNGDSVLAAVEGTSKTNLELTNEAAPLAIWAGEWVEFVKTDGGSEVDEIDEGLSITRGNNQGIYNSALEEGYDDSYGDPDGRASPKGTVWNKTGGWGNLSDVATRVYDTFYNIHGGNIGGQVLPGQYVMKDVANNTYYKVDFTVWGNANNGAPVSYTRTQIDPADGSFIGSPVSFVKLGYADPFLVYDAVSSEVHISRGNNQSIFNTVSEQGYNNNSPGDGDGENSPEGTLWNLDGWRNLTDVKQRTYLPWVEAFDYAVGAKILNSECVMYDTANDKYYALKFTSWTGGNNGGGFAYRRRLINTDLIFVHTENGNEIDDIAEGIGITRDSNYGIYNPYDEGSWDETVSPGGTEWSFAGNHDLSDIETRPYQPFFAAQNYYGIGNRIEGREAVMRLTGTNTYYTIKFLNWQAGGGGAFSYIRTPVDLDKINEGIRFADGTVQKTSATDPVKFRGPIGRSIEEYYGYKEVRITEATAYTLNTTARGNRNNNDTVEFNVPDEQTQQDLINGAMRNVSVSFDDGVTWIPLKRYYAYSGNWGGYYIALSTEGYSQTITYNNGDNIKIRYWRGGEPQLWFDPAASPGGRGNFRGAIIEYHAYCEQAGTIVGKIMVANDDGDYNVTHSEVASGGSDVANVNLWYSERSADDYNWNRSEGKLYAYRLDGDNDTIKIQWKATMFYGQEFWD